MLSVLFCARFALGGKRANARPPKHTHTHTHALHSRPLPPVRTLCMQNLSRAVAPPALAGELTHTPTQACCPGGVGHVALAAFFLMTVFRVRAHAVVVAVAVLAVAVLLASHRAGVVVRSHQEEVAAVVAVAVAVAAAVPRPMERAVADGPSVRPRSAALRMRPGSSTAHRRRAQLHKRSPYSRSVCCMHSPLSFSASLSLSACLSVWRACPHCGACLSAAVCCVPCLSVPCLSAASVRSLCLCLSLSPCLSLSLLSSRTAAR